MKTTSFMLLLIVAAMVFVGSVCADSNIANTVLTGNSDPITLTLTAPASMPTITLVRNQDNRIDVSPISAHSNVGGSGVPCHIVLTTSTPGHDSMQSGGSTVYLATAIKVLAKDGITWNSLTTANPVWSGTLSTTDVSIPVSIDQFVTMGDTPASDYHISLTFTLSQDSS